MTNVDQPVHFVDDAPVSAEAITSILSDPEDIAPELKDLSPDERVVAGKILPFIASSANKAAEAAKAAELEAAVNTLKAENETRVNALLDEIRKASTPPSPDDLARLVGQEYGEIEVKFRPIGADKAGKRFEVRTFTLTELPQDIEMQMVKTITATIRPFLQELSSMTWKDGTMAEKIARVMDIVPSAADALAELCALSLDPYRENGIDKEWVRSHIGSTRIINIVTAQVEVAKLRDFFSAVSRLIPSTTML